MYWKCPQRGTVLGMTFISYAQNFEDVMLWRALQGVGSGFYIDVGAAHPDIDSVTRAFYDRGWTGINVEPVPGSARRLAAARLRDVTLPVALSDTPGRTRFFVVGASSDTGLSTMLPGVLDDYREHAFDIQDTEVEVETLAEVCRRHAPGPIHFLKVDVEGAERAVLAGADFQAFRPWIVLVEATAPMSSVETHGEWEGLLLAAGYRFVWFDGLNRFYVADERADALERHFRLPPNVFDGFVRAGDSDWVRRLGQAEVLQAEAATRTRIAEERGDALVLRLAGAEAGAAELEARGRQRAEELQQLRAELAAAGRALHRAEAERAEARQHVAALRLGQAPLEGEVQALRQNAAGWQARAEAFEAEAREAGAWLAASRASTSWRVTAPLRGAVTLAGRLAGRAPAMAVAARAIPDAPPPVPAAVVPAAPPCPAPPPALPAPAPPGPASAFAPPRRTVHQFHAGSATGDAITAAMLMTRRLLREAGYRSDIFVEHVDPALAHELRPFAELPPHDGYVLLVRHSMGQGVMDRLLALPAPKVLLYHNITPPKHLGDPGIREAARLGREQLAQFRPHVAAALADSAFNALELQRLGFDPVRTCTLLVDPAALAPRVQPKEPGEPFTILFVGRVIESKGQLELIESYARFVHPFGGPSRLVLVGRHGGPGDAYAQALHEAAARHGIGAQVAITGAVPDAERDGWYDAADLYVSLSRHEGFGVPLVEAMARGVPVLAWPAGAVPDTLGGAGALLDDAAPSAVAGRMLELARDPKRRAAMAAAGRAAVGRFAPALHMPRLIEALVRAGAAPPPDPGSRAALGANLRFAVAGEMRGEGDVPRHNRAVAAALEAARPGRVRVLAASGGLAAEVGHLAGRGAPDTGPEVVICQFDPVRAAPGFGDLRLALVGCDGPVLPASTVEALAGFDGVLARDRETMKVLVDSGVAGPLRLLGEPGSHDVAERLSGIALDLLTAPPPVPVRWG